MRNHNILYVGSLLIGMLSGIAQAEFYRYVDETGTRHVSTTLPREALKQGYEILNNQMMVKKRIAPELTAEEKNKLDQEKIKAKEDHQLLATYSSSKNAISVRDRKIRAMEALIDISQSNLTQLNSEYEGIASEAANYMQLNKPIPEEINKKFERIEMLTEQAKATLATQEAEAIEVKKKFDLEIEKLQALENKMALEAQAEKEKMSQVPAPQ